MLGAAGALLEPAAGALDRARVELDEAAAALERAGQELDLEGDRLESVEERLFALRAAARKHQVPVDELARLRDEMAARLARIDAGAERLGAATEAARAARTAFAACAAALSKGRSAAAARLAAAVMAELAPLKLDKARLAVRLAPLPEAEWSGEGAERVAYEIATNPGQEPGPLARIASGGELARVMLALKVVLARVDSTPCLVFDEVDTGIGGATADAVGERLAQLGTDRPGAGRDPRAAGGRARGSSLAGREGGARRAGKGGGDPAGGRRAARGDRPDARRRPDHRGGARRRRQPDPRIRLIPAHELELLLAGHHPSFGVRGRPANPARGAPRPASRPRARYRSPRSGFRGIVMTWPPTCRRSG